MGQSRSSLRALFKAMRPKQWIKNLILFAGFVFTMNDQWRPFTPSMWSTLARSAAGFLLFSLLSSSVYLINDVLDADKDRQHPRKRHRPIAVNRVTVHDANVPAKMMIDVSRQSSAIDPTSTSRAVASRINA